MGQRPKVEFRRRKSYAQIPRIVDIPDLVALQFESYSRFLQRDVPPENREKVGLEGLFHSIFPIQDFNKTSSLEFSEYRFEEPKYLEDECRDRGMTYAAPVKVELSLVIFDTDEQTGARSIHDVKEQEVYFGEIPLMTPHGTFIINGTERVIVSQLHRSPGAFFEHDKGRTHSSGKLLYSARIIPYRGAWLDFEFDQKDLLHVRIDRRRKMPATVLLRALGYSTEEILRAFYPVETIVLKADGTIEKVAQFDLLKDQIASADIVDPRTGAVIVRKNRKITRKAIRRLKEANIDRLPVSDEEVIGRVLAHDVIDMETGEVLAECNEEITEEMLATFREHGIDEFDVLFIDGVNVGPYVRNTLLNDPTQSREEALLDIYRRMRPGDPPTPTQAETFFKNLFFNPQRYDLSAVGRLKLNYKFRTSKGLDPLPLDQRTLTREDILDVVKYLVDLKHGNGQIDDIDHLGNRRVRAVGELLEIQYRVGLTRMERGIRERMSMSQDLETLMPHDLVNAKPVTAAVREYFGSSQLSQFMDQTNPLSEITHKRRLSALGPGGLTRERAGFEVRDVHPTHYGRICPIETPEGPNIGLIASLSTYARVNQFGFIETPYRVVKDGRVTDEVRYCSALDEERHVIAQANAPIDEEGKLVGELVSARREGEFALVFPDEVTLMDVSPNQLVSVAASLVPFLEHDDANRALMGSNMQRQAVPLLRSEAPLVGTGMEAVVASDSGVTVVAEHDGIVESVDASRIVVRRDFDPSDISSAKPDIYKLVKFRRSNQDTCINQRPIVKPGDRVTKGQVIADGPATESGELALGRNVLVAFMPWNGYNFEDSILISERLVKDDVFTSIHIEEFECVARDTKLGPEEITRDIPNVGEEALRDLDEAGIIRVGAEVKAGDILVGKVTPKGETQLSPEEKLLRAIFGEKAGDVRDTSLRVPPGVVGTVIGAQVFSRKGVEKDERAMAIEIAEVERLEKDRDDEIRVLEESIRDRVASLLEGKTLAFAIIDEAGNVVLEQGEPLSRDRLQRVPLKLWRDIRLVEGDEAVDQMLRILDEYDTAREQIERVCEQQVERLQAGDELPPGVIKMVKVYVAIKRKLQVGDKMAGRHGNKGVVSRVLPEEDMPFMLDGTPVDMVLNPLGVPSRMNVGQILETHLGMAVRGVGLQLQQYLEENWSPKRLREALLEVFTKEEDAEFFNGLDDDEVREFVRGLAGGMHVATSVFDGASEEQIHALFDRLGMPRNGQTILFDGRTGEPFEQNVTVGVMYVLKLHHLVDDKIHARSIGPYSLVTQQPLGGKAQFGGQRLGEMEVWAMEAYGAAYGLQEFLTVKSDDVIGRTRMYESIVRGENKLEPGLPESFNVLLKELKALALDVELVEDDDLGG